MFNSTMPTLTYVNIYSLDCEKWVFFSNLNRCSILDTLCFAARNSESSTFVGVLSPTKRQIRCLIRMMVQEEWAFSSEGKHELTFLKWYEKSGKNVDPIKTGLFRKINFILLEKIIFGDDCKFPIEIPSNFERNLQKVLFYNSLIFIFMFVRNP